MTTSLSSVAILGTGHMGGAILGGLTQPGIQPAGVWVTTRTQASAVAHHHLVTEARSLEKDPSANQWAAAKADIIVLGVKPHQIIELVQEIAPHAKAGAVLVSVAAGITIAQMEAVWPGAVIRSMPNTPARVGRGVTGISLGSKVSSQQRDTVRAVFETVGEVLEVPESEINLLSAFSGSGPAYVFFLMEQFVKVALQKGFTQDTAKVMVEETFQGALALLDQTGGEPEELRAAVTSPGGTTQAALAVFGDAGLPELISEAVDAAVTRAKELAGD